MTETEFFREGRMYRNFKDGAPSTEWAFLVQCVGRAPAAFEHHAETLGVAFGWRRGLSRNGRVEGLGSYVTPDFAGWQKIPASEADALLSEPSEAG
ncbi:hypothetical protein KCMC57_up00840 [Kitasatospora sp. CMC57]|uniref:Uncharacterized protein n=1 Tax=Kitasatospora sp. CMC57 TaxID=3231513 RepID=A0AB33JT12_9ACTN